MKKFRRSFLFSKFEKERFEMKEDKIKQLLRDTDLKAGKNFKDRVMHQILMEEALRPKKLKTQPDTKQTTFGVFGFMFAMIVLSGLFFYFGMDQSLTDSMLFFKTVIVIAIVAAFFYLISVFDDAKMLKQK